MKKYTKLLCVLTMIVVLTVNVFLGSTYASVGSGRLYLASNNSWYVYLSSGTIGVRKYALTSIVTQEQGYYFQSVYVDAELFCSGIENPYDYNQDTNMKKLSVSVNNSSGGTSYGYGRSTISVGDSRYGYGGTTVYN